MYNKLIKNEELNICQCGNKPVLVWHFITGIANKIHYFVRCPVCKNRTSDRKNIDGAVKEWNEQIGLCKNCGHYQGFCNCNESEADKLLQKVIDYNDGNGEYNFSNLNNNDRANESFDAWQKIRNEINEYFYLKNIKK